MRILKPLLAGLTLVTLAAPALASAQPYYDHDRGGDYGRDIRDGGRDFRDGDRDSRDSDRHGDVRRDDRHGDRFDNDSRWARHQRWERQHRYHWGWNFRGW